MKVKSVEGNYKASLGMDTRGGREHKSNQQHTGGFKKALEEVQGRAPVSGMGEGNQFEVSSGENTTAALLPTLMLVQQRTAEVQTPISEVRRVYEANQGE